jgi:hypothetical protein
VSQRNSLENKAKRRAQRVERHEKAAFVHEVANESPEVDGKKVRFKNRKERRN